MHRFPPPLICLPGGVGGGGPGGPPPRPGGPSQGAARWRTWRVRSWTDVARRPRLDPAIFNLPVERMRQGYYSDKYFVRAREVLLPDGHRPRVLMQVFNKGRAYLGGIDEAIAILKLCAIEWSELAVQALYDGDEIRPWETVLTIEGPD